eukprot:scaffold77599_cov33-Tisochrysis_lutea.AAC.5
MPREARPVHTKTSTQEAWSSSSKGWEVPVMLARKARAREIRLAISPVWQSSRGVSLFNAYRELPSLEIRQRLSALLSRHIVVEGCC